MTTSSARPDHLTGFAADLARQVGAVSECVDRVSASMLRYQQTCPDGAAIDRADLLAQGLAAQARDLRARVVAIADAFARADDTAGSSLATAEDLALSRTIVEHAPGIATGRLLGPVRFEDGRRLAASLAGLDAHDAAGAAATLGSALTSSEMAAGFVEALGADGLTALYVTIARAHETHAVGSDLFDAALAGITDALRIAGPTLAGPDLGILDDLGGTETGQALVRHLSLTGTGLDPRILAHLAGALFDPVERRSDGLPVGSRALLDRLARRGLPPLPDLAMLELLRADLPAARLWEAGSPSGTSRLAPHLTRRRDPELDAASDLARQLYVDPVTAGAAAPWTRPVAGGRTGPDLDRTDAALRGIVAAVQGMDRPPPVTADLLVDLVVVHPRFFDDLVADRRFESLQPDDDLVGYFEVIARRPVALERATAAMIDRGADDAGRCLASTGPGDLPADGVRDCVEPVRTLGLHLEAGARRAGREHDALAGFGVAVVAKGAGLVVGKGAGAVGGPPGALLGYLGGGLVTAGEQAAADRYVDTDRGLDRAPATAMDRSLPYLAAVAMAEDPRWRGRLIATDVLTGLAVVDSDESWHVFLGWIDAQPPAVADTLRSLVPAC